MTVWQHAERLAREHPHADALVVPGGSGAARYTFREFRDTSLRLARALAAAGVRRGDRVASALPNSAEIVLAAYATWRCGAMFVPLSHRLPAAERTRLLELAAPRVVVGDWADGTPGTLTRGDLARADGPALAEDTPPPSEYLAIASGGSTGKPKLIVNTLPLAWPAEGPRNLRLAGLRPGQRQLVLGPLYHNGPFAFGVWALAMGHALVIPPRFEARATLDAIDDHRIAFVFAVPTHMLRMRRELAAGHPARLDSLETLLHSGAACPAWLKRWWLERLGPERVMEVYGTTEGIGMTVVRGDEWLRRPGTVGRAHGYDVQVLGEDGRPVAPGESGEIFLAPQERERTYRYLGAPGLRSAPDGLQSVGDLGWMDVDGWLYLLDRRADLIITGGSNVHPAEVEAALIEHPEVADVAVIGLPDEEWGRRVHAVVQIRPGAEPPSPDVLTAWTRERIAAYKAPRSYEFVTAPLRADNGKLTRARLIAERTRAGKAAR
jgi:bile acid-coenzyme A ligase